MDLSGVRLLRHAMQSYLERWPGGDPEEQEAIRQMVITLTAAQLELSYSEDEE